MAVTIVNVNVALVIFIDDNNDHDNCILVVII